MKHAELAKTLAQETGLTESEAKTEVEELVQRILEKLRQGRPVKLPGVGKLQVGKKIR